MSTLGTTPTRESASVARLRVRDSGVDPVIARLRVERLLSALDLRPRGLSRRAILCVRELHDPLPGVLAIHGPQVRPPLAWEQALRRELDRLTDHAARPARGSVPSVTRAVVFDDEAELLACLGTDLITGILAERWWWPLLLRTVAEPPRAVAAAWLGAIEHAPAALERLAERQLAGAFVRSLARDDVPALLAAIVQRFALPAVDASEFGLMDAVGREPADRARRRAPLAPWARWVVEAEARGFSLDQREFLGIALTLLRAPALARSSRFAAERATWRIEELALNECAPKPSPEVADAAIDRSTAVFESIAVSHRSAPAASSHVESSLALTALPTQSPREGPLVDEVLDAETPSTRSHESSAFAVGFEPRDGQASESIEALEVLPTTAAPLTEHPPERLQEAPTEPLTNAGTHWSQSTQVPQRLLSVRPRTREFGAATDTDLGGLFYLVNLAMYVGLYGDEDNLSLPIWDFVSLVGARLLTAPPAPDPIWALLARLAGHEAGDPTSTEFVPAPDWRLPPKWLAPFEACPLQAGVALGRLTCDHPAGFVVFDVPVGVDLERQLARELEPYPACSVTFAAASSVAALVQGLERWLAYLVPYLRARLRLALDVSDEDLGAVLLRQRARVHVSDTHIDVVLSLERLPVAIRVAGLDRDPGWVPAAGRFIAFHFE